MVWVSCGCSMVMIVVIAAHVVSSSTGGCVGAAVGLKGEYCDALAVLVMTLRVSRCCDGGATLQSKAWLMVKGIVMSLARGCTGHDPVMPRWW